MNDQEDSSLAAASSTPLTPLADVRQSYELAALDVADVRQEPIAQLQQWLQEALAADALEPTAMTLATVDDERRPHARIVLLKHVDREGLVWFTNYDSDKGRELAHHPAASLLFFWPELQRQVRVEGSVERVKAAMSDAYFASRPLASQWGAIASPQSRRLQDRAELQALMDKVSQAAGPTPTRPAHWGGYRLVPHRLEFWQGRQNRLHDRIVYQSTDCRSGTTWEVFRIAP